MTFRAGQKVVCVNALNTNRSGRPELVERQIYHVRWCGIYHDKLAVKLVEIPDREQFAGLLEDDIDMPFGAHRFRPLVDSKTDISVFTKMLDDVRDDAPVL